MRTSVWVFVLAGSIAVPAARGGAVTADGRKLAAALDAMNVEHLWLPHRVANWKTGEPLDRPVTDGKAHTHCSAFVAAACQRLGVYILRPPEHGTANLANAQADWLAKEGTKHGWKPVATAAEAQRLANRGVVVVAAFKEPGGKKPGHVALVRPSDKTNAQVRTEGPQIIQAGMTNANSISLKDGFRRHPGALAGGVRYFAHESPKK